MIVQVLDVALGAAAAVLSSVIVFWLRNEALGRDNWQDRAAVFACLTVIALTFAAGIRLVCVGVWP